jgi:D-alanine-D-alanine ligase
MSTNSRKLRIGLLHGGPSSEHEVSLNTAKQINLYLNPKRYIILPVKISRTGIWPQGFAPADLKRKIDLAFLALHGEFGEDGIVQGLLESFQIPYTFSGVLASALAMDKWRSTRLAESVGIAIPETVHLKKGVAYQILPKGAKVVVKPNASGSSIGVSIVPRTKARAAIQKLFKTRQEILVQSYIAGTEVTVSVIGNHTAQAMPVVEIAPTAKFFDYHSKYAQGGSEHIIPARLPKTVTRALQAAAVNMHYLLGCRGVSRSDFIVDNKGKFYYLETNTIPGMTATSLLPQAAAEHGIPFPELLDQIIDLALS